MCTYCLVHVVGHKQALLFLKIEPLHNPHSRLVTSDLQMRSLFKIDFFSTHKVFRNTIMINCSKNNNSSLKLYFMYFSV